MESDEEKNVFGFLTGNAKILRTDGTRKSISAIKTGDKIRTFRKNDNGEFEMVESTVIEIKAKNYSGDLVVGYAMDGKNVVLMPSATPGQCFLGLDGHSVQAGEVTKDFLACYEKMTPGGKSVASSLKGLDPGVMKFSGRVYNIHCVPYETYIADGFWMHC